MHFHYTKLNYKFEIQCVTDFGCHHILLSFEENFFIEFVYIDPISCVSSFYLFLIFPLLFYIVCATIRNCYRMIDKRIIK